MRLETRAQLGLRTPRSRPRFPGPLAGVTSHWNGPAMRLAGRDHSECRARWLGVQLFHMNSNGWADVAYSAAVCHHEIVMEGRGVGVRTAANGTNAGNDRWYAIFFMVGVGEEPSPEMLRAAEWYARTHLGTTTWNRHKDHKATACSGTVDKFISGGKIQAVPVDGPPVPPPSVTPPKKTPAPQPTTTWTESIVNNLPLVRRRTNLGTANDFDRRVQGLLVAAGVLPLRQNVDRNDRLDGKFGPSTENAVKVFQRRNSLTPDGIVGRKTWTKLLGR